MTKTRTGGMMKAQAKGTDVYGACSGGCAHLFFLSGLFLSFETHTVTSILSLYSREGCLVHKKHTPSLSTRSPPALLFLARNVVPSARARPWLLRMELNREAVFDKRLDVVEIAKRVVGYFDGGLHVIRSDQNSEKLVRGQTEDLHRLLYLYRTPPHAVCTCV